MDKQIQVMLVDDDPDFIYLIKSRLVTESKFRICATSSFPSEAIEIAQSTNPDIVLMDLNLTGNELDGISAAKEIRRTTDAKIIILTSYDSHNVIVDSCTRCFASGYLLKNQSGQLNDIICQTALSLTPQEHLITKLIFDQLSFAEKSILKKILGGQITLNSAEKTITNQKTSILKKLGLKNTKELIHIFRSEFADYL